MSIKLVKTRFAQPEDIDTILKIEALNHKFIIDKEKIQDPRQFNKRDIIDFIGEDRTRLFVVEAGDLVEGFLMFDARNVKDAIITRLSVNSKRIGLGLLLLREAQKLSQKSYSDKLFSYVYEHDDAAIAFFKKNGFKGKLIRGRTTKFNEGQIRKYDEIEFSQKVDLNINHEDKNES